MTPEEIKTVVYRIGQEIGERKAVERQLRGEIAELTSRLNRLERTARPSSRAAHPASITRRRL